MKLKIIIVVFFIISGSYFFRNFIMNISSSEPLGIYRIEPPGLIKSGDVVAVCLNAREQKIGLSRNYLIPGVRCSGSAPLIKTVIAVPGDTVVLKEDRIIVNDKEFPYATKSLDSHDRRLASFPRGVYTNTKKYWLIGVTASDSWDSRYWGGLDTKNVLFRIRLIRRFSL